MPFPASVADLGTGVDDGSGYDVRNAGATTEAVLEGSTGLTALTGANSDPDAKKLRRVKRQANKIGSKST